MSVAISAGLVAGSWRVCTVFGCSTNSFLGIKCWSQADLSQRDPVLTDQLTGMQASRPYLVPLSTRQARDRCRAFRHKLAFVRFPLTETLPEVTLRPTPQHRSGVSRIRLAPASRRTSDEKSNQPMHGGQQLGASRSGRPHEGGLSRTHGPRRPYLRCEGDVPKRFARPGQELPVRVPGK